MTETDWRQTASLIRSVMKLFGGYAMAHGVTGTEWDLIGGAVIAVTAVFWSFVTHQDVDFEH